MSKRIAIIGASDLQLPLILKAKEMGFETHVFAWRAGDAGESVADYFYPISITQIDQILDKCREIGPSAVATIASDLAAITVNQVANALGLPSNPPETAIIATNKYEMRRTFLEASIPVPSFMRVGPGNDLSGVERMHLPIIVKPTDRSGSRGIYKLNSLSKLDQCVKEACEESFEKKAVIEEYIEGEEYSCECISQGGVHHFLAITKKYTTGEPHFIETGHLEPSGLPGNICHRVQEQVFRALDALHITCGASHSEFKVTPEGDIRFIEIGARMGGDCIGSDLVPLSTGFDFVKMVIQAATGEPLEFVAGDHERFASVRYIMNEEDYRQYLSIKKNCPLKIKRESAINYIPKSTVTDSSKRFGFYIVTGQSMKELIDLLWK